MLTKDGNSRHRPIRIDSDLREPLSRGGRWHTGVPHHRLSTCRPRARVRTNPPVVPRASARLCRCHDPSKHLRGTWCPACVPPLLLSCMSRPQKQHRILILRVTNLFAGRSDEVLPFMEACVPPCCVSWKPRQGWTAGADRDARVLSVGILKQA